MSTAATTRWVSDPRPAPERGTGAASAPDRAILDGMTSEPRRLVLLRHAKAEHGAGMPDTLRPLALQGRRQCTDLGSRLVAAGLVPERVLVSSAVRPRPTWDLIKGAFAAAPEPDVAVDDRIYDAGPAQLFDVLAEVDPRVRSVLVVGHEPTLSLVAHTLAGTGQPGHLAQVASGLPTGSAAVLEVPGWSALGRDGAVLVDVVRAHH